MSDGLSTSSPLLTVAIPTWNRATYLEQNLAQIRAELAKIAPGLVEVLVSDNCSTDATPAVVESAIAAGLPIRYVRNETNLGWALNFAQSYDLASGKYLLLFGDDDMFVDGSLSLLLERLAEKDYGVVCLRPYGFDHDFRQEYPGSFGRELLFRDANQFLITIAQSFTLTSACVVNKSLLSEVDSRQFTQSALAAFHFVLRAALAGDENLFIEKYLIASKRQNSFNYEFAEVFVGEMWSILDAHVAWGLSRDTVRIMERDMMLSYYPFYLLDLRLSKRGDLKITFDQFAGRFHGRWLFKYWLAPIILLPRPLAIIWGGATTIIGRVIDGQLWRGLKFVWSRIRRSIFRRRVALGAVGLK